MGKSSHPSRQPGARILLDCTADGFVPASKLTEKQIAHAANVGRGKAYTLKTENDTLPARFTRVGLELRLERAKPNVRQGQ